VPRYPVLAARSPESLQALLALPAV
jgi:hypothetical protein